MTHLKMLAATAALVGGLGFASAASAAPLAPTGAGTLAGAASLARGPLGRCRPIARGFRPGPHCFVRRTPVGPRRICR